jgi:hypothetical protein
MCNGISSGAALAISVLLLIVVGVNLLIVYRSHPGSAPVRSRPFTFVGGDDDDDDDETCNDDKAGLHVNAPTNTSVINVVGTNTSI